MFTDRKEMIRLTWKRFCGAIRMLVESEQGPKAMICAATLVVMMLGINGLNVINSYVGRDFMSAIENRNLHAFESQALLYVLVFIASTVVAVLYRFTEERLGILWREQLTWRLTEAYLLERTYYRLDSATGVANPDQRIAEDVRAFTTTTLSFLLLILNGTLTAVSFSGVLWSISPLLFAVAVAYAVCGSALAVVLGKPLMRINYNQLDMEANFRADLIHVRENSESIALAHREGRFKVRLKSRLDALADNFRHLIRINRNLGFFTTGYNYFIQIIPALIIAPMFIFRQVEFGVITQSTMAFATLLGAFSLIVTQFQSISAFTAVTARLQILSDAIEKAHHTKPCAIQMEESPDRVGYENVTLRVLGQVAGARRKPQSGNPAGRALAGRGRGRRAEGRAVSCDGGDLGLWRGPDHEARFGRYTVPPRAPLPSARHLARCAPADGHGIGDERCGNHDRPAPSSGW